MAGAVTSRSTLPPQCGHFFKCGPSTFSIFSVRRPHFTHSYSYKGTDAPPPPIQKMKYSIAMETAAARACFSAGLSVGIHLSAQHERSPHPTGRMLEDRKSTRLNSSHTVISYAVF